MSKTVPFQTIQIFWFKTIQFRLSMQSVLFNWSIEPYQMQPFRVWVDMGVMAMKGCSAFPKAPASLEPHHQIIYCHIQDTRWGGVLPLCRGAVGIFFSPIRLVKGILKEIKVLFAVLLFVNTTEVLIPCEHIVFCSDTTTTTTTTNNNNNKNGINDNNNNNTLLTLLSRLTTE